MTIARHLARGAAALGLATLLVAPQRAAAQITYQGYPAPGNNSFSGIGSTGRVGGFDGRYSNFDDSQWGQLYWTYSSILNPYVGNVSTGEMVFDHYDAGTGLATWHSSANLEFTGAFGFQSVPTFFTLQFKPYASANGQLPSGWLTPTTAGAAGITTLPPDQVVFDVGNNTPNYDFGIWAQYTVNSPGGTALLDWYDAQHTTGAAVHTSNTGAFYATAPVTATPEPTSIVLLGTGLAGIFGAVRRRRSMRA